jgi:TonB-dependent receptor
VTDVNGVTNTLPNADKWKLYQLYQQYNTDPLQVSTGSASNPFFVTAGNAGGNLRGLLQNNFDIKETISSAFVMDTTKIRNDLTALVGVRYEKTETAGKGFDDIGNPDAVAISGTTNTNSASYIYARYGSRIERTKSYDNFFPSAQLRYEPKRNLIVRAAYFTSIQRPDFQNVVGGVSVNDVNGAPFAFTANNTELEPETAQNFDVQVEYYFEPVGVISFGVFKKDLKNIQIQVTQIIDQANVPQSILDLGFTPAELGANSTISQRINAGDTSVAGAELSYQQELSFLPGWARGFGVTANLTYVKPEDDRLFVLTSGGDGIPEWTGNLVLRYKLKNFSAQISGNWTDARITTLTGVNLDQYGVITVPPGSQTGANNANRVEWTDSRIVYGLNLSYKLHRYATLFANVNNITNEPQYRYFDNTFNVSRHGEYGATINLGVKGSF